MKPSTVPRKNIVQIIKMVGKSLLTDEARASIRSVMVPARRNSKKSMLANFTSHMKAG